MAETKTVVVRKNEDVRVDNWSNYCLQRLHVMFERGEFCDLTLQFSTLQTLKVHRVVVNLCTEYFTNLERVFGLTPEGMLVVPKDIQFEAISTIIKFFYTGKLEVRADQFNEVYRTVKLMNITILTKLLEAHARKPILQDQESNHHALENRVSVAPRNDAIKTPVLKNAPRKATTTNIKRVLPAGVKTKTVLARVQLQNKNNKRSAQNLIVNPQGRQIMVNPVSKWAVKEEPPRPTRFEWPDPESDSLSTSLMTATQTFMESQRQPPPPVTTSSATEMFEAVITQVKAQEPDPNNSAEMGTSCEETPVVSTLIHASQHILPDVNHEDGVLTISMDELMEEVVSTSDYQVLHADISTLNPDWTTDDTLQGNIPIEVTVTTDGPGTEGLEIMELTSAEYSEPPTT